MEIQILSQTKNPITKVEKVIIKCEHSGKPTPNREEIWETVAKTLKKEKELIIIDKIITLKGYTASEVRVFVYPKKEDIPKYKLEKMEKRLARLKKEETKEK